MLATSKLDNVTPLKETLSAVTSDQPRPSLVGKIDSGSGRQWKQNATM